MRRRDFIALAGAAAAFPRVAFAQEAARLPLLAYLDNPRTQFQVDGLFQGLADRGYAEGRNIRVARFIAPTLADLPAYAVMAVAANPDVIFAGSSTAALSAAQLTKTIPIVFSTANDPVQQGLVTNLARPGGNLTGAGATVSAAAAKEISFLKEVIPDLSRLAFFGRSADASYAAQLSDVLAAGKLISVEIIQIDVTDTSDFRPYFSRAVTSGAQAAYLASWAGVTGPIDWAVLNDLSRGQDRQPTYTAAFIAANNNLPNLVILWCYLALLSGLPPILTSPPPAGLDPGVLFSYGPDNADFLRRAAYFVDDILRGAKPADLPVDLATKYNFLINLKTAKALGLTVPQDVLLQATTVTE